MNNNKTHVLVADANAAIRRHLANQLGEAGFGTVLEASDGAKALQQLRAGAPVQLLLTELELPGMDGLSLLQALRADAGLSSLPVLLMSSGLDKALAEQVIRLGVADLLIKPFTSKRLLERVERALLRQARPPAASAQPILPPTPPAASERATILVVDDTPDNLQLVAGLFQDRFKVKLATHGEKAIAICQSDAPPDLVLLDVMMPGMDGFEVASRLRQHPGSSLTPIIFITALTDETARKRGLSLGAIDYVFKPIDPELLQLRVANLMHFAMRQKQLQTDFDRMTEIALLRAEIERLGGQLPAGLG